jgi:SAM-dependent methyltransferase
MKLDIGCGQNKMPGFEGVDCIDFPGVDHVLDVRKTPWPWEDNSVDEVHSSHFLEHLSGPERVGFFNELYRVLKVGGQARFITPSWSNERAYGDPTHQWPPVTTWTYFYLNKGWRTANAPHTGYTCDFDWVVAGTFDPNDVYVSMRKDEIKATMMARNINTTVDLICTLTKRAPEDNDGTSQTT